MGEAELIKENETLLIRSTIIIYGDAASPDLARQIAEDIEFHWNEPGGIIQIRRKPYKVIFKVDGIYEQEINPETIWYNDNPQLNFFRVEEFALGDISFVDGLGCNTGYFKLANLLQTSTTAAHEYGHTIGLPHPVIKDIRGNKIPGIMYPRGTLCDPPFQYDPLAKASEYGGFLNPMHRKVTQVDIDDLNLHKIIFDEHFRGIVGAYSSIYHEKHVPPAF